MKNSLAPRLTLSAIVGIIAVLLVGVGIRAGVLAAVVVALIAGALLAIPAVVFVVTERRRAAAAATPSRPVQHCDCCDKACLLAKVCAPGVEPTVVHEAQEVVS